MYMIDAGVVGDHQPTDFMRGLYIGTFFAEGDLNWGRSPIYEIGHFIFPCPL